MGAYSEQTHAQVLTKIRSSPRLPRVTRTSESRNNTSKLDVRCCLEGLKGSGNWGTIISGKFPWKEQSRQPQDAAACECKLYLGPRGKIQERATKPTKQSFTRIQTTILEKVPGGYMSCVQLQCQEEQGMT